MNRKLIALILFVQGLGVLMADSAIYAAINSTIVQINSTTNDNSMASTNPLLEIVRRSLPTIMADDRSYGIVSHASISGSDLVDLVTDSARTDYENAVAKKGRVDQATERYQRLVELISSKFLRELLPSEISVSDGFSARLTNYEYLVAQRHAKKTVLERRGEFPLIDRLSEEEFTFGKLLDLLEDFQKSGPEFVRFRDYPSEIYRLNLGHQELLDQVRFLYYTPGPYYHFSSNVDSRTGVSVTRHEVGIETNNVLFSFKAFATLDPIANQLLPGMMLSFPLANVFSTKYDRAIDRVSPYSNQETDYYQDYIDILDKLEFLSEEASGILTRAERTELVYQLILELKSALLVRAHFEYASEVFDDEKL